jgi:hypothetical protein
MIFEGKNGSERIRNTACSFAFMLLKKFELVYCSGLNRHCHEMDEGLVIFKYRNSYFSDVPQRYKILTANTGTKQS